MDVTVLPRSCPKSCPEVCDAAAESCPFAAESCPFAQSAFLEGAAPLPARHENRARLSARVSQLGAMGGVEGDRVNRMAVHLSLEMQVWSS